MNLQDAKPHSAVLVVALVTLVGAQFGCQKMAFWRSKPQEMHAASDVPAGQGTVRVSDGENGNSKVSIRVKHLAPPPRSPRVPPCTWSGSAPWMVTLRMSAP